LAASERNEEQRADWREPMKQWEAKPLLGGDESGSNIALTPLYARAPKGQRASETLPRNRGKKTTVIASLTLEGIGASRIIEGAANGAAFEASVEPMLAPSLQKGQMVVLDNLGVHKSARVRQLLEEKGCQVPFLPAYSPDFSPIEEAFSKLKTGLRRRQARTREALEEAIAPELLPITSPDAQGWFEHGGYPCSEQRMS
jgi:transposase